jgi:hypothetical protein
MEQQFPALFDPFLSTPYDSFVQDTTLDHDQDDRGFVMDLSMESADFSETWLAGPSMVVAPHLPTEHVGAHANQDEQEDSNFLRGLDPPIKRRKKKAPTLRASDWEPFKARIIELHITQKRSLPEVKKMIESELGFVAEFVRAVRLHQDDTNHLAGFASIGLA